MTIPNRPFSVEYYTKVMLPDGIFDTALKKQYITVYYKNISNSKLDDVTIYLEGVGDPGITPIAKTYFFKEIPAGSAVRVSWLADFENGSPGKKNLSFIAQSLGLDYNRTIKQIFVTKTTQDPITNEYSCETEEGTLKISKIEVIGPKDKWLPCSERYKECRPTKGPWIPKKMEMVYYPNPPYKGIHGDLPFSDPWWKILAWIIAAIAAIVAVIAASQGQGTASTSVKGGFDEVDGQIDCCAPDPKGVADDDSKTVAGVASTIASAAAAVGCSDSADPWWRGQEATPPEKDELTTSEVVNVIFDYPDNAPNAGKPYPVKVKWDYSRITTGKTYNHYVEEKVYNIHLCNGVEIKIPSVHYAFGEPLVIKTRFFKNENDLYKGDDLYAFALLRSPDDYYVFIHLQDDGIKADEIANDATYTGSIHLEEVYKHLLKEGLKLEGMWRVYVFAQDVNKVEPGQIPQISAQTIGGHMVYSSLKITFDSSLPCPMKAEATFNVIL